MKYARLMFAKGYAMGKGYTDADAERFARRFAAEPITANESASVVRHLESFVVDEAAKLAEYRQEQRD